MKKVIYILVAISTFSFSFGLFKLRPLVIPVSLPEASQNVELYYFHDVHIRAYLEASRLPVYCCSVTGFEGDYIEGAGFALTDELKKDENLTKLREELLQKSKQLNNKDLYKGDFVAEVVI